MGGLLRLENPGHSRRLSCRRNPSSERRLTPATQVVKFITRIPFIGALFAPLKTNFRLSCNSIAPKETSCVAKHVALCDPDRALGGKLGRVRPPTLGW